MGWGKWDAFSFCCFCRCFVSQLWPDLKISCVKPTGRPSCTGCRSCPECRWAAAVPSTGCRDSPSPRQSWTHPLCCSSLIGRRPWLGRLPRDWRSWSGSPCFLADSLVVAAAAAAAAEARCCKEPRCSQNHPGRRPFVCNTQMSKY